MGNKLFEIYPKPLRFFLDNKTNKEFDIKKYLTPQEAKSLLSGKVVIEEKMDGKPTLLIGKRYCLLAEDLKETGFIKYKIPARFAIFDIYDREKESVVRFEDRVAIYYEIKNSSYFYKNPFIIYNTKELVYPDSLFMVRVLGIGVVELEKLVQFISYSEYAATENTLMEGIVVKSCAGVNVTGDSGKILTDELSRYKKIGKIKNQTVKEYNIIDKNMKEINPLLENFVFVLSDLALETFKMVEKTKS